MLKYIYQGHMGGFFATNEQLDYDSLYCDQCGDSDTYIGCANNAQEAWDVLKKYTDTFDDSICENCPHRDKMDNYCDEQCKEYIENSGYYNVSYVMQFICEEFNPVYVHEIYLVCKEKTHNDYIFVNFKPERCKFGEKNCIPRATTIDDKFTNRIANNLMMLIDEIVPDSLEKIIVKKLKNKTIHIYQCKEDKSHDKDWNERASYHGDGWYGYTPISNVNFIDKQKDVEEILKSQGVV